MSTTLGGVVMTGRFSVVAASVDSVRHRQPVRRRPLMRAPADRPATSGGLPLEQLIGVPIAVATESALLESIGDAVTSRRPTVFVGLYASLFRRVSVDDLYRDLLLRSVNYPDGYGVVNELHKRGIVDAERLATTDVIHPIAQLAAERGWRIGLYGAAPGTAE